MNDNEFYLENPPIKEVALALFIDNPNFDINFINKFKNENLKDFPNAIPLKSINVKIKENKEVEIISQKNYNSYTLSNVDKSELWNISIDRILFTDKSKYSSFTNFLSKFLSKYNIIYSSLDKDIKCKLIALRYSNEFSFPIHNLNENFAILPVFQQQYKNSLYATNSSYLSISNIMSTENNKIKAVITTKFKSDKIDTSKLLINFDIEVKYAIDCNNITEDYLENCLKEMRIFKNKIFFSNVLNAKEIFK